MNAVEQQWVDAALARARSCVDEGELPVYLPDLADAAQVGLAYASIGGQLVGGGPHTQMNVSLQSITKLFALSIVLAADGDGIWQRVGYAMSDRSYSSLVDLGPGCRPSNPFVNAGALVVTDRLHTLTGRAAEAVCEFVREQSGNPAVVIDRATMAAELRHSLGNTALAYALAAGGHIVNPPIVVLEQYVAQCAIRASCADIARCGLYLANRGCSPEGRTVLSARQTRQVNGLLALAGTYGGSADTMYRIGWPAKSGVGGAILAIVADQGAVCAWSRRLDADGNSIAASVALEAFASSVNAYASS